MHYLRDLCRQRIKTSRIIGMSNHCISIIKTKFLFSLIIYSVIPLQGPLSASTFDQEGALVWSFKPVEDKNIKGYDNPKRYPRKCEGWRQKAQ